MRCSSKGCETPCAGDGGYTLAPRYSVAFFVHSTASTSFAIASDPNTCCTRRRLDVHHSACSQRRKETTTNAAKGKRDQSCSKWRSHFIVYGSSQIPATAVWLVAFGALPKEPSVSTAPVPATPPLGRLEGPSLVLFACRGRRYRRRQFRRCFRRCVRLEGLPSSMQHDVLRGPLQTRPHRPVPRYSGAERSVVRFLSGRARSGNFHDRKPPRQRQASRGARLSVAL